MAGLRAPLSTLRHTLAGRRRMTRGQCGLLNLRCKGLSPSTPCRSFPTLSHARARPGHPRVDRLRHRDCRQLVDAKPKAWHDALASVAIGPSRLLLGGEPGAEVGPAIGD